MRWPSGVAAAFALAGCERGGGSLPAPWVVFHRGGEAVVSLDTSRVDRRGAETGVRLRIDYDAPEPLPWDDEQGYQRLILHTRVNCRAATSTDRLLDMQDRYGDAVASIEAPGGARAFADHPIGAWVFPPLCAYLRSHP